jgi:copper chaperone
MNTVTIQVVGMHCAHCTTAVTEALKKLDGVEAVDVNLQAGTVFIQYDSSKVQESQLISTIEEQGYDVASSPQA